MTVIFCDTETTGLDPDRHEIWELALITEDGKEWEFQLPVDLARADPTGLRVGRFYERRNKLTPYPDPDDPATVSRWRTKQEEKWLVDSTKAMARIVAGLLDGCHLVGAVPSFDAAFLARWLNAHGQAATWHYHLVDVEALAAGKLAAGPRPATYRVAGEDLPVSVVPPWSSEELSRGVGVDPDAFDRHTALGDARWAKAIYEAVLG